MHIYVDWGGEFTTCISVDDKQSIRAFLRNLPTLEQPFYIHPFLYSIDGKSLSGQNGSGFGRDVREAVALLKNKKDAEIGRIEKFMLVWFAVLFGRGFVLNSYFQILLAGRDCS